MHQQRWLYYKQHILRSHYCDFIFRCKFEIIRLNSIWTDWFNKLTNLNPLDFACMWRPSTSPTGMFGLYRAKKKIHVGCRNAGCSISPGLLTALKLTTATNPFRVWLSKGLLENPEWSAEKVQPSHIQINKPGQGHKISPLILLNCGRCC